jgi:dienelactone hydrolase
MLARLVILSASVMLFSCNENSETTRSKPDTTITEAYHPEISTNVVTYLEGEKSYGYVMYYNTETDTARPVVLVIPEWWGLNDYPKMRARQLAELGYFAVAVDMYGDNELAQDPKEAQELATPFYKDPTLAYKRINKVLKDIRSYKQADTSRTAAIGYCFGGTAVLNAARLGSDLDGVVSFHGDFPEGSLDRNKFRSRVLIAHGAADSFVPEASLNNFKKRMDSAGVSYSVKVYEGATHAFSNPDATETGKKFKIPIAYNGPADTASWNEMKAFLRSIF